MKTFRTAYGERNRKGIDCGNGLTKQSHKDECDINLILKKYKQQGVIQHVRAHDAKYGETTGLDFQEAMNIVTDAQNMFEELPSRLRNYFKNDPATFLDFMHNPDNEAKMIELGLATERELLEEIVPAGGETGEESPPEA